MLNPRVVAVLACGCVLAAAAAVAAPRSPARSQAKKPAARPQPKNKAKQSAPTSAKTPAMTLEEAQTTVRMLDDAYQVILEELHETYPTRPNRPVAASVVRQIQERMAAKGWPQSHFLAVNALVMNPAHKAQDSFEQRAVRALRNAEERVESVEDGKLRVATLVPMRGDCGSCHWTADGQPLRAGLSYTIPLK